MSLVIVDASVVIKWFVPEVHSDAAGQLLHRADQYLAPDLLFPELGNVIWKKVRRGELSPRQGRDLAADISTVAVETVPARSLFEDACEIAIATGLTASDATYAALAVRLDTKLITADERLVSTAASNRMLAGHVRGIQEAI